ncbi:unnamed protein product, partial [Mesorhabditis spiculigera]
MWWARWTCLFFCFTKVLAADFNYTLARRAFDFAAASYADDPWPCARQYGAEVMYRTALPCDIFSDECWAIVTLDPEWLVVSFSGTRSRLQLIMELIETMGEPKRKLRAGGSVQHYFYVALQSIWPSMDHIRKHPKVLFTGHSLGGALSAIAATTFAHRHPYLNVSQYTFGEPRVGNAEFAMTHERLMYESFRVVHRYDLVAHIPYCYEHPWTHSCGQLRNHGPWHHGKEIWFPGNMTANDPYHVCTGDPYGEDDKCSNSVYLHYDITDHRHYFGLDVSHFGDLGCPRE